MIAATLTAACSLPAAAAGWYLAPMAARRHGERRLRACCAATGSLVLTYDDGPGPDLTPRLLALLHSHGARATFFLAGFRAVEHPEVIEEVVEAGHEVGCHGQDHLNAWRVGPRRGAADIAAGYRTLARWVPADGLFRPPHGKMTLLTWASLRHRRSPIGWWTIEGGDVHQRLPHPGFACEQAQHASGGVVLLHDFDRGEDRAEFVLKSTALLLDAAVRNGWKIRTLGELLAAGERRAA